jgi:hypothetical protein
MALPILKYGPSMGMNKPGDTCTLDEEAVVLDYINRNVSMAAAAKRLGMKNETTIYGIVLRVVRCWGVSGLVDLDQIEDSIRGRIK